MNFNKKGRVKLGKKGFINDILYILIGLFVFALVLFLVFTFYKGFYDNTIDDPNFAGDASQASLKAGINTLLLFDKLFALAIALLSIGLLITSYYVDSNPLFFVIALIVVAIIIVFAAQLGNAYDEVKNSEGLAETVARYPTINLIWSNITVYIAIMSFLSIAIIYGKVRQFGGG